MAAAVLFAVSNRSRLEGRIQYVQARPSCRTAPAPAAAGCGVGHLVQLREGDLLGLPFIALGLGLFLLLVYKIGHPGGEQRVAAIGDSGGDEPIV